MEKQGDKVLSVRAQSATVLFSQVVLLLTNDIKLGNYYFEAKQLSSSLSCSFVKFLTFTYKIKLFLFSSVCLRVNMLLSKNAMLPFAYLKSVVYRGTCFA